ncbi:MAG: Brix domain-containing protein [Thermosphaera aggregans]|uniref:Brix domain-containing protein n=1 Tax=Thermosphaera aggregans TaxID=54254 RepID=UPI003C03A5B4
MILTTTSHRSSQRTRSFVKDLSSVIPFSQRTTRGKKTLQELFTETYLSGLKWLLVVDEKNGNPSRLRFYHVEFKGVKPEGREVGWVTLKGVRLVRENPEAVKISNPSTISVDYGECTRGKCFNLADLLLMVFSEALSDNPDVTVKLVEEGGLRVRFLGEGGAEVGPLLRVSWVVLNEPV